MFFVDALFKDSSNCALYKFERSTNGEQSTRRERTLFALCVDYLDEKIYFEF